jgi:hypothetical protein
MLESMDGWMYGEETAKLQKPPEHPGGSRVLERSCKTAR